MAGDAELRSITAREVRAREVAFHIGKHEDDPLVGLALSGSGPRSAAFGLGVLQALQALGLYRQIDYISSVSGGSYISGWLQSSNARHGAGITPSARVPVDGPQVRFLRLYSSSLELSVGLFRLDTWAAVAKTAFNVIFGLTTLALLALVPLYLVWLIAVLFWRLVPAQPAATGTLLTAGIMLAMTIAISTLNMNRPMRDGTWNKSGVLQASTWQVQLFVVLPSLVASWLLSTEAWAWSRHHWLESGTYLFDVTWRGGVAYGLIWFVGSIAGYYIGARRLAAATNGRLAAGDLRAVAPVLVVLVITAMVAGAVGTFVLSVSAQAFVSAVRGWHTSTSSLLVIPIAVLSVVITVMVHLGLAGRYLSDETREWWLRVVGIELLVTLMSVTFGAVALAGPQFLEFVIRPDHSKWLDSSLTKSMLGALWAALTGAGLLAGKSARTAGADDTGRVLDRIGQIGAIAFAIGYLTIVAMVVKTYFPHFAVSAGGVIRGFTLDDVEAQLALTAAALGSTPWLVSPGMSPALLPHSGTLPPYESSLLLMALGTAALALLVSRRTDINESSLHALYRNRIVRCYLGASNSARDPHPYTGFDPNDDVPLSPSGSRSRGLGLPDDAPGSATGAARLRPYPLFNAALHLIGGDEIGVQTRTTASFLLSPEYCGFEYVIGGTAAKSRPTQVVFRSAYAPTGGHAGDWASITAGLAMAVSGAGASPSVGYHSSAMLSFLMTVFGVRLGWWLRNPRWNHVWTDRAARLSLRELLSELLGMMTDDRSWVYLSDGGHFDNLGLYELVRRRCRFIVVSDCSRDQGMSFADLGSAIEKCRCDFGVEIDLNLDRLRRPAGSRFSAAHCAVGTIHYDQSEARGILVYLKSSLTGDESPDLRALAERNQSFPLDDDGSSFDESQFESYRTLGAHVTRSAFAAAADSDELHAMSPVELFTLMRQQWTPSAPSPEDASRKYSNALAEIWTTVRTTPELSFLEKQVCPEWDTFLLSGRVDPVSVPTPAVTQAYWLPSSSEERRAGYYVCCEILKLMEDVYTDFALEQHWNHIDNRGWMNLFQHWAWSGMLGATFAITGANCDPRFQRFCRRRLWLKPGELYVAAAGEVTLPSTSEWQQRREAQDPSCEAVIKGWQDEVGLNYWEATLVDQFLRSSSYSRPLHLVPIRVVVESPRRSDGNVLDFNVGFLIAEFDWEGQSAILYNIRIQNHLRRMGLARAALSMIASDRPRGWGLALTIPLPSSESVERSGEPMDEAVPTVSSVLRIRDVVNSLPRPAPSGE